MHKTFRYGDTME